MVRSVLCRPFDQQTRDKVAGVSNLRSTELLALSEPSPSWAARCGLVFVDLGLCIGSAVNWGLSSMSVDSYHRSHLARVALLASSFFLAAGVANADIVRITTINGDYNVDHAAKFAVHPGDVVSLGADAFTDNGDTYAAQSRNVEAFRWIADDWTGD